MIVPRLSGGALTSPPMASASQSKIPREEIVLESQTLLNIQPSSTRRWTRTPRYSGGASYGEGAKQLHRHTRRGAQKARPQTQSENPVRGSCWRPHAGKKPASGSKGRRRRRGPRSPETCSRAREGQENEKGLKKPFHGGRGGGHVSVRRVRNFATRPGSSRSRPALGSWT